MPDTTRPSCRKSSGTIERLDTGGIPLGILAGDQFTKPASTRLGPGDWLVVFTDGVVEAVNTRGEEYEEPRLHPNVIDSAAASTPLGTAAPPAG